MSTETAEATVGMSADAVCHVPVPVCRIEGFLGATRADALLERALREPDCFTESKVIHDDGFIETDRSTRRSTSHIEFAAPELMCAIDDVRPTVESILGVSCSLGTFEYELATHGDGDFFAAHHDVGAPGTNSRVLTFVYYLHRTPKEFTGGQLRVYDVAVSAGQPSNPTSYRDFEPDHDSIVFFRPTAFHEVRPIACPTGQVGDGRFAINGWLCRTEI
ncbi:2OG-Fe(II) oxygenase [Nocardia suismassiliense]|uniref:2OG-Fe(II) oxygenase n=1 Tax=Nocardia suismassiliense TaxID=2077092 RepID=UPI0018FE5551|nr:2OG-Fe(II) oxygenase [Nocardia suismassiliense]